MTDQERKQYEYDMDTLVRDTDVIKTQLLEAEIEGRKKGLEEGRKEGREEGRKEGRKKGLEEGRKEGREEGRKEGREEGRKEGRKEGHKEGRKEGLLDTAKNLKAMGLPDEDIAYATGLSLDEVKKLQ